MKYLIDWHQPVLNKMKDKIHYEEGEIKFEDDYHECFQKCKDGEIIHHESHVIPPQNLFPKGVFLKDTTTTSPTNEPSARDPLRVNLVKISMDLTDIEWKNMRAMYQIPANVKQHFTQAIDLFDYLLQVYTELFVVDEIQRLLKEFDREDLLQYLNKE